MSGLFGVRIGFGKGGGWNCEVVFFDELLGAGGVKGDHGSSILAMLACICVTKILI